MLPDREYKGIIKSKVGALRLGNVKIVALGVWSWVKG